MRVALLSTFHERCGIATYTEALLPNLELLGAKVEIFSPKRKRADPGFSDQPRRYWARNRAFGFEAFKTFADVRASRPDIVHLQVNRGLYSSRFMFVFALLARQAGLPLIATLHGRLSGSWGEDFKLRRLLWALRDADLIVHTEAHRTELARARVHVIPHGGEAASSRTRREARQSLNLEPEIPIITHFGFLVPDKGVAQMLRVVRELRDTTHPGLLYRVAGAVNATAESRRHLDELRALRHELGLDQAVHLQGEFLDRARLMLELEAATLVVLNYQAGSGQGASGAVRHALSSGRPVVVTEAPIFDDVRAAVHTMHDPCRELRTLLDSDSLQTELAARAREFCRANSWPAVAERHFALYRRILTQKA